MGEPLTREQLQFKIDWTINYLGRLKEAAERAEKENKVLDAKVTATYCDIVLKNLVQK